MVDCYVRFSVAAILANSPCRCHPRQRRRRRRRRRRRSSSSSSSSSSSDVAKVTDPSVNRLHQSITIRNIHFDSSSSLPSSLFFN